MKQFTVKNPKLQRLLDRLSGWPEIVLVLVFGLLAMLLVLLATKVSAM